MHCFGAFLFEFVVASSDGGAVGGVVGWGIFVFGDGVVLAAGEVVEGALEGGSGSVVLFGLVAWAGVALVVEVGEPVGSEDAFGDECFDGGVEGVFPYEDGWRVAGVGG